MSGQIVLHRSRDSAPIGLLGFGLGSESEPPCSKVQDQIGVAFLW